MDIQDWLKQQPSEEELKQTDEGFFYIPIGTIENLLDTFDWWNDTDFKYQVNKVDKSFVADASILLSVAYTKNNKEVVIRKNGAVSFQIKGDDVKDHASIALSLCISNAAKKLGNRFGRSLNGRSDVGDIINISSEKVLPTPSMIEVQKWTNARKKNDLSTVDELERIYDFTQFKKNIQ